ncbi:hypothetical protein [Streptomyces sp. DH12]|uniref:hypothetical protein n=1 Tax=Streptomyces sp. DH12 TaxID=2857010 RepID=UPI001E41E422|nr:hypothetical protein [Streptomyces sp. DH12]
MVRQMVGDEQQMYRVLIARQQRRDNPDWERGNVNSPRFFWDGPECTTAYGPYSTIGAARGQLTFHTVDVYGETKKGVVDGRIQRAHTTWEDVQ